MLKKKNIFWRLDSMKLAVESQLEIQHFILITWQGDNLRQPQTVHDVYSWTIHAWYK